MNQLLPLEWPVEPAWQQPEALTLLEGTPFNCILAEKVPQSLAEAASKRGLQLLASIPPDVVLLKEGVWPGVQRGQGGSTDAGPTGPPWVDANGWAIQLARVQNPGKPVWVNSKLPEGRVIRPEEYALAIADAEAYGARRIVTLDAAVRNGLPAGESQAKEAWSTASRAARFFAARRDKSAGMEPLARLGIVSSFAGPDEFLGSEVLNLAARRHLSYRVMLQAVKLDGLAAVLWIREKAPQGVEKQSLDAFVKAGGILIIPASAAHMTDGLPGASVHETGYRTVRSGKGLIAVAAQPWSDPYVVATDAHRLMTRRHDPFRLWNASSCNAHVVVDAQRTVAHVLNFTARPAAQSISLWVGRPAASAVAHDLYGQTEKLTPIEKGGGVEVSLPAVASYVQVEFNEHA